MPVCSAVLTLRIDAATSLKDKRRVSKSIIAKTRQRFNVSMAEVDTQEIHQTLTLELAAVSGSFAHAREMLDEAVRFVEGNAEAELVGVDWV